jgi:hypothetical protein
MTLFVKHWMISSSDSSLRRMMEWE